MTIEEFRKNVKPNTRLDISGKKMTVLEVIKFRLDDGSFYFKCFLNDDHIIAEDEERNIFIFGNEIQTPIKTPFPKSIRFEDKEFEFLYDAHAVAEEVWGEEIYKKDYAEYFCDYEADDNSYLSLGYNEKTKNRLDLYGKIVKPEEVNII